MMKIKFLTIKKKAIVAGLLSILLIAGAVLALYLSRPASYPKPEFSVCIDAGHGGRDGGAEGKVTGVTESRLNLEFAQTLREMCQSFGFGVTMTRSDMNGLYSPTATNKKRSEMEKRKEIIDKSGADAVISIHMNSFALSSAHGAYVFYGAGNEKGFNLAKSIQTSLCRDFESARKTVSVGDYYVLNCHEKAGVLVECGFLSNAEEERLLCDKEYQRKMCYSILVGLIDYFSMNESN